MSRLLFPIHYPVFGGPHNQAVRLAGPLAERGWHTTVVLPDEPGNAGERLRAAGVEVVTMPLHRIRATTDPGTHLEFAAGYRAEVRALRRLIRAEGIDLVQVAGLMNPHTAAAARAEGVPLVWQLVDGRSPAALRRALMPLVARQADALMFTGHAIARLHTDGILPGQPSFVFYPPVDTARFSPRPELRAEVRAELGIGAEVAVVGLVANLNPQKGIEDFVAAAAALRRSGPDCHFLVVGAGYSTHQDYRRRIDELVNEYGLAKQITFAGARDDVERLYQAMDVAMLTSVRRSEGAPTTVLEAMACGLPVVATAVGSVRELVADGRTGLVVPPGRPDRLAGAVLRLLRDGAELAAMGAAGRARVERRFSLETCIDTHLRAYEAARDRAARGRRRGAPAAHALAEGPAARLRELLRCPACQGGLGWSAGRIDCHDCGRDFLLEGGVPVLLLDGDQAGHDELDHDHGGHGHGHGQRGHAAQQADWFDREVAERFEVERPHGTPALHAWLLGEKLRRALSGIEAVVPSGTALTVCGGSGMDAEYLARAGAEVVVSDISMGAARRTLQRARRSGLRLWPVVAAVEQLPFASRSIDLVLVHDGLHHLEDPLAGLREMARVARHGVSVTEPARAAVTAAAVRLGLADEIEDAGNRVARLTTAEVATALERAGLAVVEAERYAMFYRHQPGPAMRALSLAGALPAAAAWRAANRVLGRFGNKVRVTALRPDQ